MDRFVTRSKVPGSGKPRPFSVAFPDAGNGGLKDPPAKRIRIDDGWGSEDEVSSPDPVIDDGDDDMSVVQYTGQSIWHGYGVESDPDDSPLSPISSAESDEVPVDEDGALKAAQCYQAGSGLIKDEATSRLEKHNWTPGETSIYVDAFNLALCTVLEDESRLFDDRELKVFEHWKALPYEAQYLYTRLFLRKTASWHRIARLSSYTEISDLDLAISSLLEPRHLPQNDAESSEEDNEVMPDMNQWPLPEHFTFVDDSVGAITTIEEAAALLTLDELKALAKVMRVEGKNKEALVKALCNVSTRQTDLASLGFCRAIPGNNTLVQEGTQGKKDLTRSTHLLSTILLMIGPLIRVSEPILKLFERVHLVFYRSTEWNEKSLTTIVIANTARRNYPEYIVCRSLDIFPLRRQMLEFEHSIRREFEVDQILEFGGPPGEEGFRKVLDIFDGISARWRELLRDEQDKEDSVYASGEGAYLRRFNAAHPYTRIAHKAAYVLGRLHKYQEEHALLTELLGQRLFHPSRRGSWYQRKALLEQVHMWKKKKKTDGVGPQPNSEDLETRKTWWQRAAAATCETALEDRDCHLIYHYDLQKRLVKLEKWLHIPRRLQHDFGHVKLHEPEIHTVRGIQLVMNGGSPPAQKKDKKPGQGPGGTKTVWIDEHGDNPAACVGVEAMCLSSYRARGWKGYHAESGILRTLFAYLFYDVLFAYVPNVFQTPYQTCPLDLHTDGFYTTRASLINHRLVEIANGGAARILREVDAEQRPRRTCVVGLNWDYDMEDLLELVACFQGEALATICRVMAQDYKGSGGGVPDLVLWRTSAEDDSKGSPAAGKAKDNKNHGTPKKGSKDSGQVMFVEVKSYNDRLSDTQRLWMHMLSAAGVRVALCNAVAKETRPIK